jgi:hypothetical protein
MDSNSSSSSGVVLSVIDDGPVPVTSDEKIILGAILATLGLPLFILSILQLCFDYGYTCCDRYERRPPAQRIPWLKRYFHYTWLELSCIPVLLPLTSPVGA